MTRYAKFEIGIRVTIDERECDSEGFDELVCIDGGVVTDVDRSNPANIRVTVQGDRGHIYVAAENSTEPVFVATETHFRNNG